MQAFKSLGRQYSWNTVGAVFVVVGLCFGDEGKGSTVDWLLKQPADSKPVVRFNGGPQAAHHVVGRGRTHCAAQFGAGILSNTPTLLARKMLFSPENCIRESEALRAIGISSPFSLLSIDHRCPLVTEMHRLVGRIQEASAHNGSTGMGVGVAALDPVPLTVGDVHDVGSHITRYFDKAEALATSQEARSVLEEFKEGWVESRLENQLFGFASFYRQRICRDVDVLTSVLDKDGLVVFEGAQGALLDPVYGSVPHVTKTRCTPANALELLSECKGSPAPTIVGVLRCFGHRHGAGPLVGESSFPCLREWKETHNRDSRWQGPFRFGFFDALAARQGVEISEHVDCLGLTHMDRIAACTHEPCCVSIITSYTVATGAVDAALLDRYTTWHIDNGKYVITDLKCVPTEPDQAKLLFQCRPYEFCDWWNEHPTKRWLRAGEEAPPRLAQFATAIERLVNVPVMFLSTGQTSDDKWIARSTPKHAHSSGSMAC